MFQDFIDEILYLIEMNKKKFLLGLLFLLILSPSFFYIYANYKSDDSKAKVQKIETNVAKIDRSTRNKNSNSVTKIIVPNNEKNLVGTGGLANLSSTGLIDLASSGAINLGSTGLTDLAVTGVTDLTGIGLINRKVLDSNGFTEEDLFLIKKYDLMKKIDKYNTMQKINKIKNMFSKPAKTSTTNTTNNNTGNTTVNDSISTNNTNSATVPNSDSGNLISITNENLTNPGSGTLININTPTSPIIDTGTLISINTGILNETEILLTPYDLEEYFNNEAYYNIGNGIFKKIKTLVSTANNAIDLAAETCEDGYFELGKYSNISQLNTIILPYSNSLNNLEISEEFIPLYQGISYNYKVFNINGIKSGAVVSETSNSEEPINWVFTLCIQN